MTGFFKIIHSNIIRDKQLGLPADFVKKYGQKCGDVGTIEVPDGSVWKVVIKRENGKLWLGRGWKQFINYYSISVGHVVFFNLEGVSRFSIRIFDMTTFEIDYGRFTCKTKTLRKPVLPLAHRHQTPFARKHQTPFKGELENGEMNPEWNPWASARHRLGSLAIEAAQEYTTENRCFMVVMQPTYVEGKFALNVPCGFMKKYIGATSRMILLTAYDDGVSNGRVWNARSCIYQGNVVKIYGWKAFSEDNDLKVNDVCVFELIDMKKAAFKISIFRAIKKLALPSVFAGCASYKEKGKGIICA